MYLRGGGLAVIFIELKSRCGVASEAQIKQREEMLAVGVKWWMARSARAAMVALHLSGVVFQRKWEPPRLEPWEGPFADPTQRLLNSSDGSGRVAGGEATLPVAAKAARARGGAAYLTVVTMPRAGSSSTVALNRR